MSTFTLIFSFGFAPKGVAAPLKQGRLLLRDTSLDSTKAIWSATSSVAGKQYAESFHERGGLIPPAYRLKKGGDWRVSTTPIPMTSTKGVEGNFYKIDPHAVVTDRGGERSDFGVHLDANVPGSMGCIVMDKKNFAEFESMMKSLAKANVKQVPLVVIYS